MKSYAARDIEAIHTDELRQPWVEGFDEAFDQIFFDKPLQDIHSEVVFAAIGQEEPTRLHLINQSDALKLLMSSRGFASYFGAKQYAHGSVAAYSVLENTEVNHV